MNYVNLITQDEIFMQYVLPNTVKYALIVGPGGYVLAFLVAWALSQLTVPRFFVAAAAMFSLLLTFGYR